MLLVLAGIGGLVYAAFVGARIIEYTGGTFEHGWREGALHRAVGNDDLVVLRLMVLIGANGTPVDGRGLSALSSAAMLDNRAAAKIMLRHGANPNGADEIVDDFATPRVPGMARGISPTAISTFDRPLFWAARTGHHEMAALLREHGADYEFIDALFLADESFVRETLADDPEIKAQLDYLAPEFLRYAVEYDNEPAAKLMLDLGYDPAQKPQYGEAAIEMARMFRRTKTLALFEAHIQATPVETKVVAGAAE